MPPVCGDWCAFVQTVLLRVVTARCYCALLLRVVAIVVMNIFDVRVHNLLDGVVMLLMVLLSLVNGETLFRDGYTALRDGHTA